MSDLTLAYRSYAPSNTEIILNHILSDKYVFTNLYDTCFTDNYHTTERRLRQTFEEFFAQVDEPAYIRQLLVKAAQETDFLEIAIKMEKAKITHYIYR